MTAYRIGKTAMENTMLILQSDQHDVWFHVNGLPSAHLVYFNSQNDTLKNLRKNNIIYQMALELKKSTKYKKIPNIEIIYAHVKDITTSTKPGLVHINPKHVNIITV